MHNLTVNDLIVEYMIYKTINGYEPSFEAEAFMDFLRFFKSQIKLDDFSLDKTSLFKNFFEYKKCDWSTTINYTTLEKVYNPHMDIEFLNDVNDFLIKANYRLSAYDNSVINTYFLSEKERENIKKLIKMYLKDVPKRQINLSTSVTEQKLFISKCIAARILACIYNKVVKNEMNNIISGKNITYLLQKNLQDNAFKVTDEYLSFYDDISKKIAILYSLDENLKISTYKNHYLAKANYDLLIQDYEKMFQICYGDFKSSLQIDLEKLTILQSDNAYYNEPSKIDSDIVKKLVRTLDENIKRR